MQRLQFLLHLFLVPPPSHAHQAMKFPPEFSTKVDLTKVNWDTMKPWIAKRITELLGGLEDEVLIAYVIEQLEGKKVSTECVKLA